MLKEEKFEEKVKTACKILNNVFPKTNWYINNIEDEYPRILNDTVPALQIICSTDDNGCCWASLYDKDGEPFLGEDMEERINQITNNFMRNGDAIPLNKPMKAIKIFIDAYRIVIKDITDINVDLKNLLAEIK